MKRVYRHVNILDGTKDMKLSQEQMIVTENGIIMDILPDSDTGLSELNCNGGYLIPGLINMHVHTPGTGFPKKRHTDTRKLARFVKSNPLTMMYAHKMCRDSIQTHLMSGTTTIRTVGGLKHLDGKIRDEIAKGKYPGPRVFSCDEALTVPGGHMEGSVAFGADSTEAFVKHITDNKAHNVDWIKLMITGGVLDAKVKGGPGELKMTPEQVALCTGKAHELGLKVCAHVESPEGIRVALENGVDCIEHGSYVSDEVLRLFREKKAVLICTLSPAIPLAKFDPEITKADEIIRYNSEYLLEGIIAGTKRCLEAGVKVGVGTDTACPFITQYDFWRELEYMHYLLGLPRNEVLYMATLNNAEILGISEITGSIEKGKKAEFVVTEKDPLEGFDTLRGPSLVVMGEHEIKDPVIRKSEEAERLLDDYLSGIRD